MRYEFLVITLICFFLPQIYSQEKTVNTFHPLSGALVFSVDIGGSYPFTDFSESDIDFFGRGLVEYYFPSKSIHAFGIRYISGGGYILGSGQLDDQPYNYRTSIFFIGGGISYALKINKYVVPYISTTLSYLKFDPRDKNGNFLPNNKHRIYDPNAIMYSGELGFRFPFTENFILNMGFNLNFINSNYLDDIKLGKNNDAFATAFAGISLYVGAQKDSDGDGVEDSKDICPYTPLGLEVDAFGCPFDTDNDGVLDYLDKCQNTPKNVIVDTKGCPIDSDGDGVPDYLDKCASTPRNILVDETGCPIDSDKDGVPDYLDKCPNTPQDIPVDENGCAKVQNSDSTTITINQTQKNEEQSQILIENRYDELNDKIYADMICSDGKLYCVQLSSFQYKDVAENEVNYLKEKGHNAFISKAIPFKDGKVWFRVRIGYFNTWEEAKNYKERYFK